MLNTSTWQQRAGHDSSITWVRNTEKVSIPRTLKYRTASKSRVQHRDGKHKHYKMGTVLEHGDAEFVVTAFAREELFFVEHDVPGFMACCKELFVLV